MKKYKRICIIGNGKSEEKQFCLQQIKQCNYVIAVNGGAKNCYKFGILPDLIIGDLDSLPQKIYSFFQKKKIEVIPFPANKDKTDTELAVEKSLLMHPDEINFLCLSGGRIDHELANIFILQRIIKKNIKAKILNKNCNIELINKDTKISGKIGETISFFSLSEKSEGTTLKGFKYNLINGILKRESTLCISNVFTKINAEIKLKKGLILIVHNLED
ncbi:thiamine diphosphokinase [Candidatus Poribacteria bacterium]|nr:thiamine diphosphokinase [Candidatus Poribacteria bacterium]